MYQNTDKEDDNEAAAKNRKIHESIVTIFLAITFFFIFLKILFF
jgi:hypothetical protein